MARYDEATRAFMDKVSSPVAPTEADKETEAIRMIRAAAKAIQNPAGAVGRQIVARATQNMLSKEAAVKPLTLYNELNQKYGKSWWDWEPETIWQHLQED